MDTTLPPSLLAQNPVRRHSATLKLLLIAALIILLQIPIYLVGGLQRDRREIRAKQVPEITRTTERHRGAFEAYRVVERALNYNVLVTVMVFTAFFLFETLGGLRLHAVHYGLVGAALCLFYLALLALGEFVGPDAAYGGAAVASSALISLYSVAILRSGARAGVVAGLLALVHGILYIVLRQEDYALLAGTGALFAALGAVMFVTRNVDWHALDGRAEPAN